MKRVLTFLLLLISIAAKATEADAIKMQLAAHKKALYYPQSVERFYRQAGFKMIWIAPDTAKTHAWDAMLLLDCLVQYGLDQKNYHPEAFSYNQLHLAIEQPEKVSAAQKALCDIFLTDAMICLINNLHYGRLNPVWTIKRIDQNRTGRFHAESILSKALDQNDFKGTITGVQPKSPAYRALQYQMYTTASLHTGDCYETPESQIRLMGVNMERLRWVNGDIKTFIQINIPSNILSFYTNDTVYRYKITGKYGFGEIGIQNVSRFRIDGDRIIFNPADLPSLRIPEERKPVTGISYVRIAHAGELAALLVNKQVAPRRTCTYNLHEPVQLRITYYTCEVKDGTLVTYKDIDHLDQNMETALYK